MLTNFTVTNLCFHTLKCKTVIFQFENFHFCCAIFLNFFLKNDGELFCDFFCEIFGFHFSDVLDENWASVKMDQ